MEMTLSQAAELLGIPQKRLYRAVKAGKLKAEQHHQGSRWEYLVTREALEEFSQSTDRPVATDPDPTATGPLTDQPTRRPVATDQVADRPAGPPIEVYALLVDRLTHSERRAVELEMQLRQHQNLLSENAESLREDRAKALTAEAQLQAKQAEIDVLAEELKAARLKLSEAENAKSQTWWSKIWSRRRNEAEQARTA